MIQKTKLLALTAAALIAFAAFAVMTLSRNRTKNASSGGSGKWVPGVKNVGQIVRIAVAKVVTRIFRTTEGRALSPFIDRRNQVNRIGLFTTQIDSPIQVAQLLVVTGQEKTNRNHQIPGSAGLTGQLNTRFALV